MKDFQFLDYHTEYSCKGTFTKVMRREYCFSYIFNKTSNKKVSEEYTIILYKGTDFARKAHKDNACLFTKQQVRNHLKQAQGIYPFNYRIRELTTWKQGYTVFKVDLKLTDVPGTFHKYLLSWLRYMYEYPYNVILYDAYKLKRESCFRFTSISDLFNLVLCCYNEWPREIHQIAKNQISKAMRKSAIREKLKNVKTLNSVYDILREKDAAEQIPDHDGELDTYDLEYWDSDDIFERKRKPVYMNTYMNTYKKIKNKK